MERACKRIKLEEGEPFSADEFTVVGAHIKEEQISEEEESGSEESGSEDSEEYQSCESGGEEESNSEPQVVQGSGHDLSTSEAKAAYNPHCSECRRSFQSSADIERHTSKWHYNFICYACDEGFPSESQLHRTNFGSPAKKQKHVISGISLKPGMYICDHCDPKVPFGTEKEFCDHLWLEHVACGPCGRTFKSLRKQHDAELHHRCGVCYRFFISSGELTEHRETHVVKPPVVEQPVHVPAPVKREPTPPPPIPAPIQVKIEMRQEVPISRVAPVVAERVPVKTEVIPVTRVTPTTRPVIFAPYPPRPAPAQVPENKKTQSLITDFLIRKS
ncbi:Zinc finger and BTB domain-containing protein 17 [Fusarium odoratissimum]|uniref:Zinc finger and BTB domain-containing protein 17 n=1 Tax=Fusarium oxysporum f. sp. cubense (strain race 4) TaxID=2502994 RepID=N1R865_FUSC4|nr:Zinc finger and BTB domain-containing protein 17 [Fusarium odoratissimum]